MPLTKLKPCPNPWCKELSAPSVESMTHGPAFLACKCGVKSPVCGWDTDRETAEILAIAAWNTRPLETQMYEALKALVDAGSCTCMNQSDGCCLIASGRAALAQAHGK